MLFARFNILSSFDISLLLHIDVTSCSSNPSPCYGEGEECIDGDYPGEYKCQCRAGFARSINGDCRGNDNC
jgi:hypothetical protein